jgi:hypothetical protein
MLMENDDEMSVVEMAIMCDADINTVTKLQDLSLGSASKVFPNVAAYLKGRTKDGYVER